MTFLSIRKRGEVENLYAVTSRWDRDKRKQVKDQVFVGSFRNGRCTFNDRATEYAQLISSSKFGKYYWQWKEFTQASKDEQPRVPLEALEFCEDKNAGVGLLLDKISLDLQLRDMVIEAFGEQLGRQILSLAYFCARGSRMPLYHVCRWSEQQILPWEESFCADTVSEVLNKLTPSDILKFQGLWTGQFAKEEAVSLDITSISSYSKTISDVRRGYNRDREKLPQINLLMAVSQESKLPIWYEQLPGPISDSTTVQDTLKLFSQLGNKPKHIVLDRGFASETNVSALLKNRIKFTLGIPLNIFTSVREDVRKAYDANEFCDPRNSGQFHDENGRYFTQYVTHVKTIDGHRVYVHMYYTDFYRTASNERLMQTVNEVNEKLKAGKELTTPKEQEIAQKCFVVKTTPKRGLQVKPLPDEIAKLRDNDCGFFVLYSSACKDAGEALKFYKLRDGVEKRFDDLKNEEDMRRLRMHSGQTMRARLFIQFLAQILRCSILKTLQGNENKLPKCQTVSDVIAEVDSLRRISVENHRPFYKRPTKAQREIFDVFGIPMTGPAWPSMG